MPNNLNDADYELLGLLTSRQQGRGIDPQNPADLLVVFCCADIQVGRTAARLWHDGMVNRVIFSGKVGKDSNGLPALGLTEATFQAAVAICSGLPQDVFTLEEQGRNGKENAAFSLKLALDQELITPESRVVSLAPGQRSLRLFLELQYQAHLLGLRWSEFTGFSADPINSQDVTIRAELLNELRAVATLHQGPTPRIMIQPDFQPGGRYYDLTKKAGIPV